jgi:hypothetical protein
MYFKAVPPFSKNISPAPWTAQLPIKNANQKKETQNRDDNIVTNRCREEPQSQCAEYPQKV